MDVLATLADRVEDLEQTIDAAAPGIDCPEVEPPTGASVETLICLLEKRVDLLECQVQAIEDHPEPGPNRDKALQACCDAYQPAASDCVDSTTGNDDDTE